MTSDGPGALAEPGGPSRLFFTADGSELFISYREEDCSRWRITPAINAGLAPKLEAVTLPKPAGFTSICVTSNQVAWISTRGTRLVSLDDVAAGDGPWAPTSRGMGWISPDRQWLAIFQSYSPLLRLYRLPGLEPVATLTNRGSIRHFAFSPLGTELAVASPRRVEFWNTANWQRTREITNFMGILYAPDARTLWLTRDYRNAGLYDAATLRLLLPLPTGALPLALSPDGRRLAVTVNLRRLQVWDLEQVRQQLSELGLGWTTP